jgi:hypothetical protein
VAPEPDEVLRSVDFLRADAPADAVMPPQVWARLSDALAEEAATVRLLPKRRLPGKAIGGLIAASIVMLAASTAFILGRAEPADIVASSDAAAPPARQILASGINYTPQQLRDQVRGVLNSLGIERAEQMAAMEPVNGAEAMPDVGNIAACIRGLAKAEGFQALMVDRAQYDGVDAAIIVLGIHLDVNNQPMLDVFVVRSDCTEDAQRVLTHIVASLD